MFCLQCCTTPPTPSITWPMESLGYCSVLKLCLTSMPYNQDLCYTGTWQTLCNLEIWSLIQEFSGFRCFLSDSSDGCVSVKLQTFFNFLILITETGVYEAKNISNNFSKSNTFFLSHPSIVISPFDAAMHSGSLLSSHSTLEVLGNVLISCLTTRILPSFRKHALVQPTLKKGYSSNPTNSCPVALT